MIYPGETPEDAAARAEEARIWSDFTERPPCPWWTPEDSRRVLGTALAVVWAVVGIFADWLDRMAAPLRKWAP